MSSTGKEILVKVKQRWQMKIWAEILLYALGFSILGWFIFTNIWFIILIFIMITGLFSILKKPWQIDLSRVSNYLDLNLHSLEYSTGLVLLPEIKLSGIAQLQQKKINEQLKEGIKKVKLKTNLLRAAVFSVGLAALGLIFHFSGIAENFRSSNAPSESEMIIFKPVDSLPSKIAPPQLLEQEAVITYPAYTGVGAVSTTIMNIKAVEGSAVTWKLRFNSSVDSVNMESTGGKYPMKFNEGSYSRSNILQNSGFYNFRFKDSLGASYGSDLYSIEITGDQSPVIEINGLQPFVSFEHNEEKQISFNARISDDFGIGEAVIIATVTKGTGESVRFREERLNFDNSFKSGSKNIQLKKRIDLDNMNMEPGDELYFYIQATDLKTPVANISRTETYFVVIKDTASIGFGIESTMGVDLMPDYFRSQRQLIIDTEKLISQRRSLSKAKFNATSNDLGFDQKSLRLKYGQFMGDENEGAIIDNPTLPEPDNEGPEDPLAEFTHDHDGNNEHNLVEHDHPEENKEEEQEDPLQEFMHDHGDPESATLFTDDLRSKIRQALDIMWDSELHLRLYEPEKSLPFQYKTLALLQEIKNSARIYVHRIGYDPPPIKEDVRLTGKINEVQSFQKAEDLEKEDPYFNKRKAVARLEILSSGNENITTEDRLLFELAARELAQLAIENPGKYLNTLQDLKWLSEDKPAERNELIKVKKGLLNALPVPESKGGKRRGNESQLNNLMLQELQLNEQ